MVYDNILVIRGILLSKKDVLRIKNIVLDPNDDEDFLVQITDKYMCANEPFMGSFKLHTWPCCSKLMNKKFILGNVIGSYGIEDMYNKCVKLDRESTFDFDPELKALAKKYGKKSPKNYLLLDDCTSCS